MTAPIIHFDYDGSPYGQKTKTLLAALGVEFKKNDQPFVLPRPSLEELGITYRRIPLLAIGKDIYADSALIIDVITSQLGKIPTSPADKAYEAWGKEVFGDCLGLLPSEVLTKDFIKDRQEIFPSLARPDIKTLRPSSLANIRGRMEIIERQFLAGSGGPFIGGSQLSLADIHVTWPIKMALGLGVSEEPGFGKEDFPKVYKLIENLPAFNPPVLSDEETHKAIRGASYTSQGAKGVAGNEPTGLKVGTPVSIESFDSEPGAHPQLGTLVAADSREVVIEIKDAIHLHFPRIGYIVRAQ